MVPTELFPPTIPLTTQVTAGFDVLFTLAVNCCVCPVRIEAVVGETWTDTPSLEGAATAIVTVFETMPPTPIATGIAGPEGTPFGIFTFTWYSPTKLGARPENKT